MQKVQLLLFFYFAQFAHLNSRGEAIYFHIFLNILIGNSTKYIVEKKRKEFPSAEAEAHKKI